MPGRVNRFVQMAELGFQKGFSDLERWGWGQAQSFGNHQNIPGRRKHGVWRVWAKLNDRDLCRGDLEVESEAQR